MNTIKTATRYHIEVHNAVHFRILDGIYANCCEGIEDDAFASDGIDYLCGQATRDGLGPCPDDKYHGEFRGACAERACRHLDDIADAMLAYRATTPEEINSQLFVLARWIAQGRFIVSVAGVLSDPAHPEEDSPEDPFRDAGEHLEEYARRLCCILAGESPDE